MGLGGGTGTWALIIEFQRVNKPIHFLSLALPALLLPCGVRVERRGAAADVLGSCKQHETPAEHAKLLKRVAGLR